MAFELIFAVIHSFTKEQNSNIIKDVVLKEVVLDNALPAVISLVKGVSGLLGKVGNSVTYGQFGGNMRQGLFPSEFDKYIKADEMPQSFLGLSHVAVNELSTCAQQEFFATGGHILVASYSNDGTPFFLVAMIKQQGGVSLDKNYVPIEITEIDLTKVNQAARINILRYTEVLNEGAQDPEDEAFDQTYLCFVGQQRGNNASDYFVKALGCTKGINSSRATSSSINGVDVFFRNEALKQYRTRARDAVASYLKERLEKGENASLDEICHAASSKVMPHDSKHVEGLKEYLNGDKCKVPAQFSVHKSTLKNKTRIKEDSGQWSIQFEQQILGATPDSIVYYNKENKSLTFSKLTDRLIKSIEAEL